MKEENKEKYQEIISLITESKFMEAKETLEELFIENVTEKLDEKKNEIMERIKIGGLNEGSAFKNFVNKAEKNINDYTKIPMNAKSDYKGNYIYIQEDTDEDGDQIFYWYLLKTNNYKNIKDIKKNAVLFGNKNGFPDIIECLNNIEKNLGWREKDI